MNTCEWIHPERYQRKPTQNICFCTFVGTFVCIFLGTFLGYFFRYVVLILFGGTFSVLVVKSIKKVSLLLAFLLPSRTLDPKMALPRPTLGPPGRILDPKMSPIPPPNGAASKGEIPEWKGREGVNPSPGTGDWRGLLLRAEDLHALRPGGLGGFAAVRSRACTRT